MLFNAIFSNVLLYLLVNEVISHILGIDLFDALDVLFSDINCMGFCDG